MTDQRPHDQDLHAWANEHAALFCTGRRREADNEPIAGEIGSIGQREKRGLIRRWTDLLPHRLGRPFQPGLRGPSWRLSIDDMRDDISVHFDDYPRLRSLRDKTVFAAHRRVRRRGVADSGSTQTIFPASRPWSFDPIPDTDFWPEAA